MPESRADDLQAEMARHYRAERFLTREAELLDERDLRGWLDLVTDDVSYEMPVRHTRDRGAGLDAEFSADSFHMVEDRSTLEARVERFETEFAWSVDPPLRTRRFVTNVRVDEPDGEELPVRSNLLFYRSQGDTPDSDLLAAERRDRLRETDDGLRLAAREVRLDHTILPTKNIAFFL